MKTILTLIAVTLVSLAQAGGNFSLIEINPLHGTQSSLFSFPDSSKEIYGAGEISAFTELNGKLYFSAHSAPLNNQLWVTDGTAQGTEQVKKINATGNAAIGNIVKAGNKLLFMASDSTDFDLWSTDGTESGTAKVADLNEFSNTGLDANNIALLGNKLIFCTSDKLLITDGTTVGTDSLLSITAYSQGFGYCELNNLVYFILPNGNGHQELWRTDGTAGGTQQVLDLNVSDSITGVTQMVSYDGKMFIAATKSWNNFYLYNYDGTGSHLQRMNVSSNTNLYPQQLTVYNGALYFTGYTATGMNIYKLSNSNTTPQTIVPVTNYSSINQMTFANNSIYFYADNSQQIHRIDLTNMQYTINPLNGYNLPSYFQTNGMLAGIGGKVFFTVYDSFYQNQMFAEADADLQNLQIIMPAANCNAHPFNFLAGCGTADIFDFKVWNNKLIVPANFNEAGRELWVFEPTDVANAIPELKSKTTFSFYPNPANTNITVKWVDESNGYCDHQLTIKDVTGSLVTNTNVNGGAASINVSQLAAGNYFVSLVENGKAVNTQKLVIVK